MADEVKLREEAICEDLYAGLMAWPLFQGAREPRRVVHRVVSSVGRGRGGWGWRWEFS